MQARQDVVGAQQQHQGVRLGVPPQRAVQPLRQRLRQRRVRARIHHLDLQIACSLMRSGQRGCHRAGAQQQRLSLRLQQLPGCCACTDCAADGDAGAHDHTVEHREVRVLHRCSAGRDLLCRCLKRPDLHIAHASVRGAAYRQVSQISACSLVHISDAAQRHACGTHPVCPQSTACEAIAQT